VEEDHDHHNDTERQELQAEAGEETPMIRETDLARSQMRVGKEDGGRVTHTPARRR